MASRWRRQRIGERAYCKALERRLRALPMNPYLPPDYQRRLLDGQWAVGRDGRLCYVVLALA